MKRIWRRERGNGAVAMRSGEGRGGKRASGKRRRRRRRRRRRERRVVGTWQLATEERALTLSMWFSCCSRFMYFAVTSSPRPAPLESMVPPKPSSAYDEKEEDDDDDEEDEDELMLGRCVRYVGNGTRGGVSSFLAFK